VHVTPATAIYINDTTGPDRHNFQDFKKFSVYSIKTAATFTGELIPLIMM
jgi:hypothetical protein